ncbi:MAG: sigma-54-dependent Fis family transcriptional regulator [Deltaproteobacteria bacterium]|nr:sigma-54-dependent Fis family transcriptional regulator [Deltaproteobacteria bacterium]
MSEIVIVEDERNLRELFLDLLGAQGHQVVAFDRLAPAEAHLAKKLPDLLLLDVKLPDGDGQQLLERLRDAPARCPTIVMTAFGTVERAVAALRAGARDFLVKPFENARLLSAVAAALESADQLQEVELGAGKVTAETETAQQLVGASGGLREVVALLPRVAATDATVLLRGESGTGKELVARAIHQASPRMDGPFIALNCAALPPSLLESELFGFERGAFTGAHARHLGLVESAHGGTLFLDEIGDMSLEAQGRLLRVLQEREVLRVGGREPVKVDVRVLAATHRDLAAWSKEGRFRADLLYRLAVVPIDLPPLRARPQDIPGLIAHFLDKHARRHKASAPRPTPEVLAWAQAQVWPGNVRELENWAERAVVLGHFEAVASTPPVATARIQSDPPRAVRTLKDAVAEAEREAVIAALRAAEGNKAEAARLLGVSYKTLFNKLHEHEIKEERIIG